MRRALGSRGFTLAETMIAIAILSMMGVLTYGMFTRSLEGRERAGAISEHYNEVRQAALRMAREISMAFISAHRNCDDPRTQTIFLAKRAAGGMRLDFTSFSHVKMRADANESDQNELSYFVDRDPDDPSKSVLMRREQARIDDDPEDGGVEQVLAENATSLEFQFYDAKEDRWEDTWDTTSSDFKDRMPMFVGIKLTTKDPGGQEEVISTKTRVFLNNELLLEGAYKCASL